MMKNFLIWAFRRQPGCRRRALARYASALLAFGLLATIPNALLSCKAKDKTDNSGLKAASAAAASAKSVSAVMEENMQAEQSQQAAADQTYSDYTEAGDDLSYEESKAAIDKAMKEAASKPATTDNSKIDLDLTQMSATMIYSTIFEMLIMPEDYMEKNIKVKGWFETYQNPETNELYYAVLVPDATACCQQGLEFVWLGNHSYPEDYPVPGNDITVTGRYKLIETNGITYTYLEASKIEF